MTSFQLSRIAAPAHSPPGVATLIALSIVAILALNMIIPSLAHMARDFDVSYAQISLAVSLFMAITAGLQLVIGPLSDLIGRRPVILISAAIYALASLGCVLAESFTAFMIFRAMQSVIVAAIVLPRAIVRDTSEPQDAAAILGTIGMVMALGPMLAPLIGGALDEAFGWRSNFVAFTAMGGIAFWLTWVDVGETNRAKGGGIGAQFRAYPRLLGDAGFWSYTLCLGGAGGVFFVFLSGTPLIATEHYGLSGAVLGVALGAPPVGFVLGNWISTRFARRVPLARMMMAGRVVALAGMAAALAVWLAGAQGPLAFFLFMPLIGLSNGLTMPAGNVGAMSVLPELAGSASGLSGAAVIGISAAMTAMTGAVLTWSNSPLTLLVLLTVTALFSFVAGVPALSREHKRALAAT